MAGSLAIRDNMVLTSVILQLKVTVMVSHSIGVELHCDLQAIIDGQHTVLWDHTEGPDKHRKLHSLLCLQIIWHVTLEAILVPYLPSQSHCNSLEDWAPIDFIYRCPIFK